jgi:hypothetical protein
MPTSIKCQHPYSVDTRAVLTPRAVTLALTLTPQFYFLIFAFSMALSADKLIEPIKNLPMFDALSPTMAQALYNVLRQK